MSTRTCSSVFFLLSWLSTTVTLAKEASWPQFRGPEGDGHADTTELPTKFSDSENVRWKTPVPGKAWSSPIVGGSLVWLTNANEEGTELSIVAIDSETGKVVRNDLLFRIADPQFCHKFNSYASPTPVLEGDRIYVTFGSPGTACLDAKTGKKIWERTDFVCNHFRAAGSSPILYKDLLIMNFDGSDHQFIAALNKNSGETVWQTKRSVDFQDLDADGKPKAEGDYRKGFSTPHVFDWEGKPVLLSSGAKSHYAYDPATGMELWRIDEHASHSPCTRPVIGHGLAYIPTGHGKSGLIALKLGGTGVLDSSQVAWRMEKTYPNKPSVTLVDDLLFVINDAGIATCLDAKSGNKIWSERLGGNFSASPIVANKKLYVGNEEGKFFVFEASREFKLLAENEFEDGFMASPAIADSAMYLRSKSHLYKISNTK